MYMKFFSVFKGIVSEIIFILKLSFVVKKSENMDIF